MAGTICNEYLGEITELLCVCVFLVVVEAFVSHCYLHNGINSRIMVIKIKSIFGMASMAAAAEAAEKSNILNGRQKLITFIQFPDLINFGKCYSNLLLISASFFCFLLEELFVSAIQDIVSLLKGCVDGLSISISLRIV